MTWFVRSLGALSGTVLGTVAGLFVLSLAQGNDVGVTVLLDSWQVVVGALVGGTWATLWTGWKVLPGAVGGVSGGVLAAVVGLLALPPTLGVPFETVVVQSVVVLVVVPLLPTVNRP
jgi:hypothetical protein